ncbi:MAG: SRPBCC family protein [Nocardioides sp.]
MNRVQQDVDAPPDDVWRVLADGWLYPLWVVGATRMRQVDDAWPDPGSRLHHSVGVWPLVIDDDTEVLESVAGRMLRLRARVWPGGEAEVVIRIEDRGAGSLVTIEEDVVAGPARLVPQPLRALALDFRNRETLRRLAWLAERRE